jgi:hypothetical protein
VDAERRTTNEAKNRLVSFRAFMATSLGGKNFGGLVPGGDLGK